MKVMNYETAVEPYIAALRMIREALEELGPVGILQSEEHLACNPVGDNHAYAEAEELVRGIQRICRTGGGYLIRNKLHGRYIGEKIYGTRADAKVFRSKEMANHFIRWYTVEWRDLEVVDD